MSARKPNLTKHQREELIADLLDKSYFENGEQRLACGAVNESAFKFSMSRVHVYRLWKQAMANRANGNGYSISPDMKGKVGKKAMYNRDKILEAVENVPFEMRRTLRDLSGALGIGLWSVHQFLKQRGSFTIIQVH